MRRVVYAESRKLRLRLNGFKDYIEPESFREVPAPLVAPQISLPYQPAVQSIEVRVT
jgi:hypothetical protein